MPDHQMAFAQSALVNTLPLEILSSIFSTLVDASLYARSVDNKNYGSTEYPTLLSSVCTHWRHISIGTPYLWSYIDLMPSNQRMRNAQHVKLWLKRSQSSPLHVRIGKGANRNEDIEMAKGSLSYPYTLPRTLENQLATVLTSQAPRIHSFTLVFFEPGLATEALIALLSGQGQHSIRELALRHGGRISLSSSEILPQNEWNRLFEPLQVLHLERTRIELSDIPCRNLVELRLISPPDLALSEFIQLLQYNPGLRTIVLDGRALDDTHSPLMTQSINLPSLRYLQLSADQVFIELILKLLVPGPHGLALRLQYRREPTNFTDTMFRFFERTNVTSLHLQGQKASVFPVLTALQHLEILELSKFDFDASTFAGLESTTNLTPKLHTIDLNECSLDNYSELYSGLRALLSLPSVQRIRHLDCGPWGVNGNRERRVQVLDEGGFTAAVIHASASDFKVRASPFR